MNIEIIVKKAYSEDDAYVAGDEIFRYAIPVALMHIDALSTFETHCVNLAQCYCRFGRCVIVRPDYNNTDRARPEVAFYEWRSFDGEALRKVEF